MGLLDRFLASGLKVSKPIFGTEKLDFGDGLLIDGIRDQITGDREYVPGWQANADSVDVLISVEDAARVTDLNMGRTVTFEGVRWTAKTKSRGRVAWTVTLQPITKREGAS